VGVELVLGLSTQDMVEEYLLSVLYGQYQWWDWEVCSNGQGNILQSIPSHCIVHQLGENDVNNCG
jgi:hypothetical protein